MEYLILLFILTVISSESFGQDTIKVWNEFQKYHIRNQEDSTTWNKELLQRDIGDSLTNKKEKPFPKGAFPVPRYELAGYFRYKGAGSSVGNYPSYNGKKLTYHYYFKGKTEATKELLNERPDEAFFIIVALTGNADTAKGSSGSTHIFSRNNPDVLCEGYFTAQNNDELGYLAFITGDREEFAVVNMKLFNLKNGRTILVAPQKDHSLRFLQISTPLISGSEVQGFLNKLLEQNKIKDFFLRKGSL